eukprot:COSAG03_NODE_1097_length_4823_cov_21.972693_5_plen_187_part_00
MRCTHTHRRQAYFYRYRAYFYRYRAYFYRRQAYFYRYRAYFYRYRAYFYRRQAYFYRRQAYFYRYRAYIYRYRAYFYRRQAYFYRRQAYFYRRQAYFLTQLSQVMQHDAAGTTAHQTTLAEAGRDEKPQVDMRSGGPQSKEINTAGFSFSGIWSQLSQVLKGTSEFESWIGQSAHTPEFGRLTARR